MNWNYLEKECRSIIFDNGVLQNGKTEVRHVMNKIDMASFGYFILSVVNLTLVDRIQTRNG